ncbi:L-2-amino-thiazoline-4-carboxylic acid hydrolase [Chloroflexota bacterium]
MNGNNRTVYYLSRKSKLLERFYNNSQDWKSILAQKYGDKNAGVILSAACWFYEKLLPELPNIGGDRNHMTEHLLTSAECLAFYKGMKANGKSAEETGKILYDSILLRSQIPEPPIPPSRMLSEEELIERRKRRAQDSQERKYSGDWVYEFVQGDGEAFDYGYDFNECGAQKFYHSQGANEFLPFYCFLDYPISRTGGYGLERTDTLAEGHTKCDHRFKKGRKTESEWPPLFIVGKD